MEVDDAQLAQWRQKQLSVASRVVVPKSSSYVENDDDDGNKCTGRWRCRYIMPPADVSAITHDGNAINKNSLLVGGLDVSFPKDDDNNQEAVAVYVILRYNNYPCTTITTTPQLVYRSHKFFKPTIPYIASYLAFREAIPLLQLISTQIQAQPEITPNVLFVDGNGQWHERRAGIACFVGVETGIPTVRVGKNFYSLDGVISKDDVMRGVKEGIECWYEEEVLRNAVDAKCVDGRKCLVVDGKHIEASKQEDSVSNEPTHKASMNEMLTSLHLIANGLSLPMLDTNTADVLAYALVGHGGNVCNGVRGVRNPIYISAGSNITLEDAVVLSAHLSKSRVPEPVREADSYGRKLLREQRTTRA